MTPADALPLRLPAIDTHRCTGCGRCVAACAPHLLSLTVVGWKKHADLHDPHRCTACADCVLACPFRAITMRRRQPGADAPGPP